MSNNRNNKVQRYRLLQIDEEIRNGRFPNSTSLAKKIEVSSRTIQRDIEYMKDMYNAPIEYDYQKNGYYYTELSFYIKSVPLSEGELFSVALFDQLLEQYRNTPLENDLRSVFKKIEMSLPNNITFDSSFLQSQTTFIPDQIGMINPQNFETVFSALKNRHVLKFKYRPLQKTTWMEREINPLHAVCQKGNWYILGFCHDKQDIRVFNFSRMKDVVETKETFDFPSNFAPEKYFDKEIGIWLSATQKYTVELLISAEIGTFALERSWNKNQKIEQRDDGSVWVSFETTQLPEVKRWVLGQGKTVKVLNPPELIEQVREEVTAVLRMY
ncbi:MAG: YafY family transcriptional regulator [Spirochaetaceae bacterium]|nr:YafY family transcriptional regulator [Spirochaetaceae bacterium]